MALSVTKGQKLTVAKAGDKPVIAVGLSWDEPPAGSTGADFDLDVSAFALDANGELLGEGWVVFYHQTTSADGAITHSGDETKGAAKGDDETILIDTGKLDPRVNEIAILVTLYDATARRQVFGMAKNPKARVYDAASGAELGLVFELDEEPETQRAISVHFGSVYKRGDEWKWNAVGQGFSDKEGLAEFITFYSNGKVAVG